MKSRSQSFFDKIGKYKVLRLFLVAVSFDEEQHGSDRWEDITLADLEVCTNTQIHKYSNTQILKYTNTPKAEGS